MAKIDFYQLARTDKAAIFTQIAEAKGMKPFAVEKDWWVSRTLEIIFQMPIAEHLVFKGGTSLSKAWKLLNRFSEDIDLAIDKTFFGFSGDLGKSQRDKLRKTAGAYTTGTFFEELKLAFDARGFTELNFMAPEANASDQDPRVLEIYYPHVTTADSAYIQPRVQIEISCRSLHEPFTTKRFGSLVDELYAGKEFAEPLFDVPAVNPERTVLEKLFLLHEEFHRPFEKMRVDRLSRHLYDIYQLTQAGITHKAISDKALYETIVAHRYKYARLGEVDYNLHHPATLNPIPPPERISHWEDDYAKMMEDMIYDENKPSFDTLIHNLTELRTQLQAVNWPFELVFSKPHS